jgi:ATP-dependent RNA helicase HelY
MKRHPCHACPDRETHARWAERWWKLHRDTQKIRRQISSRTSAISLVFDRIMAVLVESGYLVKEGEEVALTPHGHTLRRIYGERDLLVAESLRRQLWTELTPAELAAMVATLVYEPRRDDQPVHPRDMPGGNFNSAFSETRRHRARLAEREREHDLPESSDLSAQLALPLFRWASGERLEDVLEQGELTAGDFVRWCKQVIDVLDQISSSGEGPVQRAAISSRASVFRGIVALSSVI